MIKITVIILVLIIIQPQDYEMLGWHPARDSLSHG